MATTDYSPNSLGRVVQVIGPVVDVAFDSAELPEINTALLLSNPSIDKTEDNLTIEVSQHLGETRRVVLVLEANFLYAVEPKERAGGGRGDEREREAGEGDREVHLEGMYKLI